MERLALFADVSAVPRRPWFLVPLYRKWRDHVSDTEQWYLAGVNRTPAPSIHCEDRARCVREWLVDHQRYRWTMRPLPPLELDAEPPEGRLREVAMGPLGGRLRISSLHTDDMGLGILKPNAAIGQRGAIGRNVDLCAVARVAAAMPEARRA
ncbi:hypothetical protein BN946_scf185016.g54 [Trametes cinnabarina]|uniref:Uncharacterized protein n=1 Tax=Pycnoporus cinnabarinus TaxID=5643 RepID=A0A060SHB8_PYCCI|nr:hypothetical protein BN946_scf185016.g54 [Trametes cinnabarina]